MFRLINFFSKFVSIFSSFLPTKPLVESVFENLTDPSYLKCCLSKRKWTLVNECQTGDFICDPNAFCTDTPDSYHCICEDGFHGDGKSCSQKDINECEDGTHLCDASVSTCVNNEGSYSCKCFGEFRQIDS